MTRAEEAVQLEGGFPIATVSYYASLLRESLAEGTNPHMLGGTSTTRKEPLGVVAAIAAWNFPQCLAAFKYAPALAAGCTVVLKPSPETVLDSELLAQAAEAAGLPSGVLNIVTGGRETGAYLVQHPDVNKVAFTGSTGAGRAIAEVCGRLLRPVNLELGGKSAAIVLDGADAIRIANDSPYGLGGSVWTTDEDLGMDVARQIQTGTIGVNTYLIDMFAKTIFR